jgi:hypothetical protein
MMLRTGQTFTRREWKETQTGAHQIQDEVLAESERKLREVLSKLNRDPTGMLSDFDMHATHYSAPSQLAPTQLEVGSGQPNPSMISPENHGMISRSTKKRKANSHGSVPTQPVQSQASTKHQLEGAAQDARLHITPVQGARQPIDFRIVSACPSSWPGHGFLSLVSVRVRRRSCRAGC